MRKQDEEREGDREKVREGQHQGISSPSWREATLSCTNLTIKGPINDDLLEDSEAGRRVYLVQKHLKKDK